MEPENYPNRNAASRPPRETEAGSARTSPDYTEIPLSSMGRSARSPYQENSAPRGTVYGRPAAADENFRSYSQSNPYYAAPTGRTAPNYARKSNPYAPSPEEQKSANTASAPQSTPRQSYTEPAAEPYGASRNAYPQQDYGAPQSRYPQQNYGTPRQAYPQQNYGASQPGYPQQNYGASQPGYPQQNYGTPRQTYPQRGYGDAPNRNVRPATQFTEVSWDSFRQGNIPADPYAAQPRQPQDPYAAPQRQPQDPYAAPQRQQQNPYAAQPRQQDPYAAPQREQTYTPPRQGAELYGNLRQKSNPYASAEPLQEAPPTAKEQRSGLGDLNRPAAPRTAARFAAGSRNAQTPAGARTGRAPGAGNNSATPPRPPKGKLISPLFLVVALVLIVLIVVIAVKFLGNGNEKSKTPERGENVTATATALPQTTDAPENAPEETPAPTPEPTPEPSPTPSGAKAKKNANGLVVPADWGVAVPERRECVYDSHFDKSVMIGNSLVEGFFMWSGMTNIKYIYNTGAVVNNVLGVLDLASITLNPGQYEDIYLMFGLNEVGTSPESFVTAYIKVLDYIREYQPSANIYVISVTPVTDWVDADPNEVQSMERIDTFNAALKQMCLDYDCWYLDIYSMLLDDAGFLSADYAFAGDGKHFEKSGYVAWANYMKTHYVDEKLLTE